VSARVYLLTEGVHDVFFLGKILTAALRLKRVEHADKLDPEWMHIVPKTFPHEGSLRPTVPAPTFYKSTAASVAIVNADGIDRLGRRLRAHHETLTRNGVSLDALGVVLDADFNHAKQKDPARRFAEMADVFAGLGLPRPAAVAAVAGTPRTGVFILPGGGALGTLEDVLLECAAVVYPTLGCRAVRFIDGLDRTAPDFVAKDLDEIGAPSGRHKAVIAAMGAVLKPGKPTQASIEDHRWIEPRTLALPRVAAIVSFLRRLVEAEPVVDHGGESGA
jgi:hypothetical protein